MACLLCFFSIGLLNAAQPRYVPGQILVKTRPTLADIEFEQRLQTHGVQHRKKLDHPNVHVLNVPEALAESVLAALRRDPDIEFAERDGLAWAAFVPNDPYVASGSEWHLGKINAPQAWDFTTGSSNIVIAILDSGVNSAHPDLAGHILPGYNFVSGSSDTSDEFGHGTAVTGTAIAAGNNGIGVAGVSFGCMVLPVKVVDSSGFASYSAVAEGIHYAVDHGARVINLSIAGDTSSITLQEAVDYAWTNNVVIVAAAGNNATSAPQYPAACNHVIGVSATEPDDSLAAFSSYGDFVTLAAPGDNIWTLQRDLSNPYGSWRGTSFSSPIVASVAALVTSVNPSLSSDDVMSLLEATADDVGILGVDTSFGYGRVNAFSAILAAAATPGAQITMNLPPPQGARPPATNATFNGNYAGLLANTNGVSPADSGCFALRLNKSRTFSGRLRLAGKRYGFHGQLNADGDAAINIRRSRVAPLMLALHLDSASGSNEINGSLTDGFWVSQLLADRNVFSNRTNPAQQAGVRTFLLEQSNNAATVGTASSRIAQSGSTHVRGKLADLRSFSTASTLAANGDYPFYLSFNHGAEVVIGWLNFPAGQDASSGNVFWVRSGTNSFAKSLKVNSAPAN